ncbi:unnamed protein product, partial [Tilletia controversa]
MMLATSTLLFVLVLALINIAEAASIKKRLGMLGMMG